MRFVIAVLSTAGLASIALVLLPTLCTLAFVWLAPQAAGRYGGWVTIGAIIAVPVSFPGLQLAAHRVLVGRLPGWAQSPGRLGRLLFFGLGALALLLVVLLGQLSAGVATLISGVVFLGLVGWAARQSTHVTAEEP